MHQRERQTELVAICSGMDWTDAAVTHFRIPLSVDLEEEWAKYLATLEPGKSYCSWVTWLTSRVGAQELTDSDIYQWGP